MADDGSLKREAGNGVPEEPGAPGPETPQGFHPPTSDTLPPSSAPHHPTPDTRHPSSAIRHPTPDTRHLSSGIRLPGRPLFWLTICFVSGIFAARFIGQGPIRFGYLAAAALVLIAASVFRLVHPARFRAAPAPSTFRLLSSVFRPPSSVLDFSIPALLFFLFGIWAGWASAPHMPFPQRLAPFFDRPNTVFVAEVSGPPDYYTDRVRIPLLLLSAVEGDREVALHTGAILTVSMKDRPAPVSFWLPGDRLLARLTLRPFHNFQNPGGFDYARYQAEKGFYASAYLGDGTFLARLAPPAGFSPGRAARAQIDRFRQRALFWLRGNLDPDSAAFYAALLLGYRQLLSDAWKDRIQRTGLNHLLTISGLHLALVSFLIFRLVRFLVRLVCPSVLKRVCDSSIAVWPALAGAVAYAFLAGFGAPPVWRSILMLAVCFGAVFRRRSTDPLTVLALAALVILACAPECLWQVSFQLTFTCLLGIILIHPRLAGFKLARKLPETGAWRVARSILSRLEDAFWVSVAVSVLVLPLSIFYFNGFSLAGLAANVLLVPWVGLAVLPSGLLSLAMYAISENLAAPFLTLSRWLLAVALALIRWFDGLSWSFFWTGSVSTPLLFAAYAALAFLFLPLSRKTRFAGLGAVVLFLGTYGILGQVQAGANDHLLRADVIDVGQGSSALIRFPSGAAMLVDGGGFRDDHYDVGRGVVAPFLWHEGVRRIDYVVLSHDHPDHRNGLRFVLSHFDVGSFWTSRLIEQKTVRYGENVLEAVALKRHIPVCTFPDLSREVRVGEARVRVVHPDAGFLDRRDRCSLNDLSLVLEIGFGDTSILLPGDIGSGIEAHIVSKLQKDRVLLVSPHHGSANSNSEQFLDALRPEAVVFSCGYNNIFGFPARAAVERCCSRNIHMYRTDLDGAVHAVSDGRHWTITTEERQGKDADLLLRGHSR